MPYKFTFDFTNAPRFFFTELALVGHQKGINKAVFRTLQDIIKRFKIQEATGMNLSDAVMVLQDMVDMHAVNHTTRGKFLQTKKRALLLPHCSRKYMDSRCKAIFDASIPTYVCQHCSADCGVNEADRAARQKGYDVYILPGGSCVPKILKTHNYEGLVGVACGEEAKMSVDMLSSVGVTSQAVPLIKNGCANTVFSMDTLIKTL
jgi:uncharacterized protein